MPTRTIHSHPNPLGGKGDGGVDIISASHLLGWQCKRQKERVPVKVVRELLGSLALEHSDLRGVLVTSAELTREARALADRSPITVMERPALADWMVRVRERLALQGAALAPDQRLHRHAPQSVATKVGGSAVSAFLVAALSFAAVSAHSPHASAQSTRRPATRSSGRDRPAEVVRADFAAINRHDWKAVWRLWYHRTRGYGPAYRDMVNGYRLTATDVVTSLHAHGDVVTARVIAHETTGAIQTYFFSFTVRGGKIVSGYSALRK